LEYHIEKIYGNLEDNLLRFSKNIGFLLDDLCGLKDVDAAIFLDANLNVIAHSKYSVALHFLNVNYKKIKEIETSEKSGLVLHVSEDQKSIIAASCFKNSDGYMYLIIKKSIDSNILSQAKNTRIAYDEYFRLLEDRSSLEIAFIFMFLIVGILLLIASISVAIVYSWRIVKPVSNLIDVSEEIINGNLKARAKEDGSYEEINLLNKTFNQMIEQIDKQREDLVRVNRKLDERMKFTTSVLAGVSSGVIGTDNYAVYIWNTAAEKLLGEKIIFGEHIGNIFPEIVELLELMGGKTSSLQKEIQFKKHNQFLLFSVKVENLTSKNDSRLVITFSDLTDMVAAQRKAAWSEVARRVAHEIKNPLTPIQLSAERIKRKYLPQITKDAKVFSELTNVIIRQVGDIKRLIDEFNFFARLPEPNLKECNLYDICSQAIFLMQNSSEDVKVTFSSYEKNSPVIRADERLLHQSIVNLIQNAINALSTVSKKNKKVVVSLEQTPVCIKVLVEDNGPGFPKEKMETLATPYFTLMPKGTGLGLAIVKKIVQDHGGELFFEESIHGGAKVIMSLPLSIEVKNEQ
jgi:two-component system nitrogen regulation sensor histidine kinase NtrY